MPNIPLSSRKNEKLMNNSKMKINTISSFQICSSNSWYLPVWFLRHRNHDADNSKSGTIIFILLYNLYDSSNIPRILHVVNQRSTNMMSIIKWP